MMKTISTLATLLLALGWLDSAACYAQDAQSSARFRLTLLDGQYLTGQLTDCDQRSTLAVQSVDFAEPLHFPMQPISRVRRVEVVERQDEGAFRFLLTDSSNLVGKLAGLTQDKVTIASSSLGTVELARDQVSRIMRRSHEDVQLAGIGRTAERSKSSPSWKQTMGPLLPTAMKFSFKEPSTIVSGEDVIPEQAEIRLAISWLDKPNFVIALTTQTEASADESRAIATLETWQDRLVLVLESPEVAQSHVIIDGLKPNHRLELTIFLNRVNNTIALYTPSGRALVNARLLTEQPLSSTRLKLSNFTTDDVRFGLRLDSMIVRHWNGHLPDEASSQGDLASFSKSEPQSSSSGAAGSTSASVSIRGDLREFDPSTGQLLFATSTGTEQMPLAQLEHLSFGGQGKRASDDLMTLLEDVMPPAQKDARAATGRNKTNAIANNPAASDPAASDPAVSDVSSNATATGREAKTDSDLEHYVLVQLIDGSLLLGQLLRVQDGQMVLQLRGSRQQIQFRFDDLQTLQVIAKPGDVEAWAKDQVAQLGGPESVMTTDSTRLLGTLADSAGAGQLSWRPTLAQNASHIAASASGVIDMEKTDANVGSRRVASANTRNAIEIRRAQAVQRAQVLQRARGAVQIQQLPPEAQKALLEAMQRARAEQAAIQGQPAAPIRVDQIIVNGGLGVEGGLEVVQMGDGAQGLVLRNGAMLNLANPFIQRQGEVGLTFRSGDQISGTVTKIDPQGVTFKSDMTTTTFAGHDQLDSVVLLFKWSDQPIPEHKIKRLLTVPRSMKANPPTHLILSANGDYLRGRLQSLDENELVMDVGDEQVQIKRDQVAKIYWLYERDWTDSPAFESSSQAKNRTSDSSGDASDGKSELQALTVYVIDRMGRPLTFIPQQLAKRKLSGTSEILKECSVTLDQASRIYFARDIEPLVAARRTESWKLSAAATPRAFQSGDEAAEPGSVQGDASPLVGQPAPVIELQSIQDMPWKLSDHHGRIVVLDFWASWCGPCMQAMPEVERIVSEVGPGKVDLVAVNLQESKEKALAALERLKISPTVVLDTDGQMARAYQARAIPQTVIIDSTGKITHLFIGGGKRTLTELEAALKSMVQAP